MLFQAEAASEQQLTDIGLYCRFGAKFVTIRQAPTPGNHPHPRLWRHDGAIANIAACGVGELAAIRYDPRDPRRTDLDLCQREITVRGKGGGRPDRPPKKATAATERDKRQAHRRCTTNAERRLSRVLLRVSSL
jgi:hypothetical protein